MGSLDRRVREFLQAPRYAVLATINPGGSAHLTEMWYGIRQNGLFFNTTEERTKKQNLDRDPRVSLLVAQTAGSSARDPERADRIPSAVTGRWRVLCFRTKPTE